MNALLVSCAAVVALAIGNSGPSGTSASRSMRNDATLSVASSPSAVQEKGRYKKEGDDCVWVTTDSGPHQCMPVTRGRFKKGGNDSCTWDSNDAGPDQCKPPKGRWKKGNGDDCTWDANDSGPNQCNPRRARARK
jgi:hypothetical protein